MLNALRSVLSGSRRLYTPSSQPAEHTLGIPNYLLRDHCRCPQCYNEKTCQRLATVADIPQHPQVIETVTSGAPLKIKWSDGHKSIYSKAVLDQLKQHSRPQLVARIPWTSKFNPEIFSFDPISTELSGQTDSSGKMARVINDTTKPQFFAFLKSMVTYGLAVIRGVPAEPDVIHRFLSGMTLIKPTVYGEFWDVVAEEKPSQADTSYTNVAIGPHTDGTYLEQAPGIQVFSALKLAKTGGENVFVDGEYCLTQLSDRFNPYDRATHPGYYSEAQTEEFYSAYRKLTQIINEPSSQIRLTMQQGDIYFVDNFRVLHGRTAFTGERRLCGCYLDRDEFQSRLRVAGLID